MQKYLMLIESMTLSTLASIVLAFFIERINPSFLAFSVKLLRMSCHDRLAVAISKKTTPWSFPPEANRFQWRTNFWMILKYTNVLFSNCMHCAVIPPVQQQLIYFLSEHLCCIFAQPRSSTTKKVYNVNTSYINDKP